MAGESSAGPSKVTKPAVRKAAPTASAAPKAKVARAGATIPAQAMPKRTAKSGTAKTAGVPPPVQDTKPQVNAGEEEWAELMRGGKGKGTDWYAKGVKSVQVCLLRVAQS